MSYALITGELGEGRYTIQLDWGQAQRTALLAAVDAALAQLAVSLAANEANLITAEAREAEFRAKVAESVDGIIAAGAGDPSTQSLAVQAANALFKLNVDEYAKLVKKHQPLREIIVKQKLLRADYQRRRAKWEAFVATETRQAWCTTYTLGASGRYAATIEVDGESELILIAPQARGAVAAQDGLLTARELMSPEQAFLNAALLPGWQKYLPTYRWGTITSINEDANTADVSLADARSSAQRLPINHAASLSGVPVRYLDCDCHAFAVGDRVIVQSQGQDWDSPQVIGFLDNPKPCLRASVRVLRVDRGFGIAGSGSSSSAINSYIDKFDGFHVPDQTAPAVGGVGKFLGWFADGVFVSTAAVFPGFDIQRGVTPSTIEARFFMPSDVWGGYGGSVALENAYHTTWEFLGLLPAGNFWQYKVYAQTEWSRSILFASSSSLDVPFSTAAPSGFFTSISHTGAHTWTGPDTLKEGATVYAPPAAPGQQFDLEAIYPTPGDSRRSGSAEGHTPFASLVDEPVIGTTFGTITYEVQVVASDFLVRYTPVSVS